LVAKVVDNWEVHLTFELAHTGLPRIRLRGPELRPTPGRQEWDAILPHHLPTSPFQVHITFYPSCVGVPGDENAV
jgi:hypothetical protein